ncbi:MAG: type VI secretion system Vgr family protein [bacterium]
MIQYKSNEPLYQLHFSELPEDAVHVLAFEGDESISRLFEYRIDLISEDPELDAKSILNKKATFILTRGEQEPIKLHGIISHFEQRGRTPEYVLYHAVLVPKMWRLALNFSSNVFQKMDIEKLVSAVLKEAGFTGEDYEFHLNESYPQLEYCAQYRETDFDFVNRRLEHYGIYYHFDHRDDNEVMVFTDSIANLPAIAQEDDILYNPNKDPMSGGETVTELTCQEKVVTGLFKLKDYNYEFPSKNLRAETQLDAEAPGMFYDYGDHFKDEKEGDFLARVRNEEILCTNKIFRGAGDSRLFRPGFRYKLGGHYREDWNAEYILTKVRTRGNQGGMFAILASSAKGMPAFESVFESIPAEKAFRPSRLTPIPRIAGIMTAKVESGAGDEYAFIDDHGRYKMKVPFDLSENGNGEASRPIRLSQPYSGPGYGLHFPNHADTEIVWACVDGNVDRPLGLATVPNPSNASPSTSGNRAQSVIRSAGQNELTLDDTTGSENIYLHGTKDWTIHIVNDKNQTIGHDETAAVGNNRSRNVGNDETIVVAKNRSKTVGVDQSETIGSNKTIQVGANHTETIAANKTMTVGGTHTETISGTMSQTVAASKAETVAVAKALSIGAAYQVSVGAAMNETVGGAKAEEIGGAKMVNVGLLSMENVGLNKLVNAGGNISESAGKKMTLSAKDEFVIKCGDASITLKDGNIIIKGKNITMEGKGGHLVIKGLTIAQN